MRPILLVTLLSFLVSCTSVPSSKPTVVARLKSISAALKQYHEEMQDYPQHLAELHPRYLASDLPLQDEKYPTALRELWVSHQSLDPQFAPSYQRLDRDYFVSYQRIDKDNYSLRLIYHGKFVTVGDCT